MFCYSIVAEAIKPAERLSLMLIEYQHEKLVID